MINIKKNPYIWDTTAQGVNMDVLSMDLKAENGSVVKVENMNAPLTFTLAAPDLSEPTNSSLIIHLIKNTSVIMFNQSESNFISFNFTVKPEITTVLELIPVSNIRKIKIHISDSIKPSFQNISNIGVLYPDELNAMNTELSDFKLTNLSAINMTNNYIYITYKNSSNTYSGVHYVGLTVDLIDNATLEDLRALDLDCIGNDTRTECETSVEIILKVKTKTLSCTYWDITLQQWKSDGCEVSPTSTDESLICLCTHMTSFAGGVFVLPNFIDPIADAELFLTFFENPVVVTTVIVVWMLYFFLIHWARQADKKDEEKVGVIAVDSIDMEGHIYLMCVVTGWWSEAGTTSNVYFHINGTNGSSKKIKLSTSLRRCFQTGYEDWFIVSTEHNLGDIDNITLWHDNTGNSPHWYLSQLYLKDLKTKESWTFIYNDWLAVDRGHLLQTTATIAAINQHELKNLQKHNFMTKTTQDLRNTHLWISIFSKPARSTFTRAQRLTCALSLLLCNMLTNIMFYGVPTDNPEDQVSSAGGVSISLSAIVIGLQSSLIMFPVNIIIMQMFLKLKQKPLTNTSNEQNKSYIHELLNLVDTVSKSIMKKFVGRNEASSMFVINKSSSEKLESQGNYDTRVSWSSDLDYRSFHSAVSDPSLMSITSKLSVRSINTPSITVLSEEKQTGKSLPWWFLYIAWCLVLGISFVCSYFVMLYGLKYGYQKSIEWLVSFFTGFSQSALVTQPIKVLGVAIAFSFLFKKAVEFEDYGPEVRLDEDEDYKRSVNDYIEPHIQFVQPLSTRLLQQIKDRIQLEWLMNVTLFDIGLYFIYMTVVCFVVHGQRDINKAYYNSLAIEDVLINPGCANPNNCFFLEKVDNMDTFYQYLYDVAIPNLIDMSTADHEYATPGSSHFLIGPWRLRQLRVEKGSCNDEERDLYDTFGAESHECSSSYWLGNEDNDDYNKSWSNVVHDVDNQAEPPTSWTYQSAWRLKTIPFSGRLATYSGGGYIVTMPSNSSLHEDTIDDIKYSDWIDERTRVVFLEFNLYNPNANLFSVVIILFEFSNTGAVIPYHQIYSTKLYHYSTDLGIVVAVCEGLFLAFNIMFIYIEWKKFSKLGRKEYFEDFWSYIEIIQIGLAFSVVGLFFQRLVFIDNIMKQFRESNEEKFVSFYTAISWDLILGYVMAFLVAVVTLKSAKLLRFNKRTYMIADALSHVKHMLVSVIVMAVLLFVAFSSFAMFAFGKLLPEYRDFLTSLITVFNLSLGVSDLPGLTEANRILGPIFYVIFVFFVMFIFMTIFMAIVDYGISESKSLLEHRQNKFELLEYVIRKIKVLANIR
ncbi:Polycystic kidney disease protein 1-like [Mactra antiquata]